MGSSTVAKLQTQEHIVANYKRKNIHCLRHSLVSKIVPLIAIVASDWIVFCRARQQGAVPTSAAIISFATPGAIATRDKLAQELVAASALSFQCSRVVPLEHMLQCKHAKQTTVAWAVVTVEVIIMILQ